MRLVTARVELFRSIDSSGDVPIDPRVTVLVGRNESGKTAFLHALDACRPAVPGRTFDPARDYPRKFAHDYRRRHPAAPATVARLTYELAPDEVAAVNAGVGFDLLADFRFAVTHDYADAKRVRFSLPEEPYVRHLVAHAGLTAEAAAACAKATTVRELLGVLAALDLNADGRAVADGLSTRFAPAAVPAGWDSLLEYEVWRTYLEPRLPRFAYFDEYSLLPDKINLPDLARRAADPTRLTAGDRVALGLLQLAGVDPAELAAGAGYEDARGRLEGAANAVADTVFAYWTQGRGLDLELDVRPDPADRPPFDSGPNLYVRVRDRRDRATVPFGRRSRGFVWFFSFVVGFETVRRHPGGLVLLLDEPALSLHPLAQADFLRYVDALADTRQVILTTHSPFLVRADRLAAVRLVEDRGDAGTVVTADFAGADPATLFPVRAAVGAAAVADLAGGRETLLVPGPADLIYLTHAATLLAAAGRPGLPAGVAIVPAGGLTSAAAFAALSGAGGGAVVLHAGGDEAAELAAGTPVLTYAPFRAPVSDKPTKGPPVEAPTPSTVEDLFGVGAYLKLANAAYAGKLPKDLREADLPAGGGVVGRLVAAVDGFDSYMVAAHFATTGGAMDKGTLSRFEGLFGVVAARGPLRRPLDPQRANDRRPVGRADLAGDGRRDTQAVQLALRLPQHHAGGRAAADVADQVGQLAGRPAGVGGVVGRERGGGNRRGRVRRHHGPEPPCSGGIAGGLSAGRRAIATPIFPNPARPAISTPRRT